MELFEALAADLGDEWKTMAEFLGVNFARVQAIIRDNSDSGNPTMRNIVDMLISWYKNAPKNCNKVNIIDFGPPFSRMLMFLC